jgi:hypothetical protein
MLMAGRFWGGDLNHRNGFNGKENDDDAKGYGDQVDCGARVYDPKRSFAKYVEY